MTATKTGQSRFEEEEECLAVNLTDPPVGWLVGLLVLVPAGSFNQFQKPPTNQPARPPVRASKPPAKFTLHSSERL